MRRKRRRYQSRHQLLFRDQSQRWHSQKPPAKRKRADDNAANGEVVDFCDIFRTTDGLPRGHNVGKHEAQAYKEKRNLI
ncbi:hypothetical protein DPMN_076897 [Dreissena polymorpha]|uniref:Uncharacterized protein n=1 Tax=Dreissena polymorpha TaxID=45954 RepID=A0A9D3YKY5_DREPO|nr:hypothetical protein DPMN_076897 [Dreissena polymorpha]